MTLCETKVLLYASQQTDEVDDIWERSPEAREDVRPMLADWGETSQFLALKRVVLDEPSRKLFLDYLYGDFAAALKLLVVPDLNQPPTHSQCRRVVLDDEAINFAAVEIDNLADNW